MRASHVKLAQYTNIWFSAVMPYRVCYLELTFVSCDCLRKKNKFIKFKKKHIYSLIALTVN